MSLESYKILEKIGQGSYGEVWLVEDKARKKCVLKKIIFKKGDEKAKQGARSECILLKKLIHPNIVQYRDSFEEGGSLYIAMSYCEGGDLYSKIKERDGKNLSENQVAEWLIQILMALSYMHKMNILHRDLKTQNIFLAKNSIVKVGDLGIAKQLKNTNDMASTVTGTPYYMSPELFSNEPYNFKSDIWSLGCITYEMVTLKHAFNAKSYNALSFKIIRGQIPPLPKTCSKELRELIESMLNVAPKKRPSTDKILREPYIQQHIKSFLDRAKSCKKSSPRRIPIMDKGRSEKGRSPGSSPFKCSPEKLPSKFILESKPANELSNISTLKAREEDDDNDVVCSRASSLKSRHSLSSDNRNSRRSSKTVLEKEIEKRDNSVESRTPLSSSTSSVNLKHSESLPQMTVSECKVECDNHDAKQHERHSARNRRREKKRDEGLNTMFIPISRDVTSCEQHGNDDLNVPGRQRRRNNPENENVNLPELRRRTDTEYDFITEEASREELNDLVDKMSETLSFSLNPILMAAKDSLQCPINCYDDGAAGPKEDDEETLSRTKLQNKRYLEIRKELMKNVGFKKVYEAYEILKKMDGDHEVLLKDLLSKDGYERYGGKIMWLNLIEEVPNR